MGQTLERAMVGIVEVMPFLAYVTPMIETSASREIPVLLDRVSASRPEDQEDELSCEYCSEKKAEIFQVTGIYCLQCWQVETHPNV
jgi:hypothetical protein